MSNTVVSCVLPDKVVNYLNRMITTGLYGGDLNNVVEHLVLSGIQRACKLGIVPIDYSAEQPQKWICQECEDGMHLPPHLKYGDKCPGCDKVIDIPF